VLVTATLSPAAAHHRTSSGEKLTPVAQRIMAVRMLQALGYTYRDGESLAHLSYCSIPPLRQQLIVKSL
jgi:hypothetical protein